MKRYRFLNYSIFSLFILLVIFGVAKEGAARTICEYMGRETSVIQDSCASCITSLTNTQGSCCGPIDDDCAGRTKVTARGCTNLTCSADFYCCTTLPDCSVTAVATPNPIPVDQDSVTISVIGAGYTSCTGIGPFTQIDFSKIYTVNCTGDVDHSNCSSSVTVTKNPPIISGTAIIASSCGVDSATVTANVAGGVVPYKQYTWYKQVGSGAWNIDYEQICPVGGCGGSHIYALFGQTINAYLRVEDISNNTWASNILSVSCGSSLRYCGINPDGSIFCGTGTLGLSGTGRSCNFASDCGVCKKR